LTPPRSCLEAKTPSEFQTMHFGARAKGAGLPVWGILPKIIEVNRLLEERITTDPRLQDRIIEFHPELTWKRLAGSSTLSSTWIADGDLVLSHDAAVGVEMVRRTVAGLPRR